MVVSMLVSMRKRLRELKNVPDMVKKLNKCQMPVISYLHISDKMRKVNSYMIKPFKLYILLLAVSFYPK